MSFDFDAAVNAPFRMQPGLRRLAAGAAQLTPAEVPYRGAARHLREKLAVLSAYPWQALLCSPGFDPGPALSALARQASTEHPHAFQVEPQRWSAPWLGWTLDAAGQSTALHNAWPEVGALLLQLPARWRHAALLSLAFAEDFAIVDARDATIPWLAVSLPSSWAPEDKVGRSFTEVHAPVADNRLIVQASDHLLRLVTGTDRWERFVWTLSAHPRLHAHPQRVDPARWPNDMAMDPLAALTWFRSERQTFIPVPGADQAVFTILVDTQPLAIAIDTPERARRLHAALATMSDAVLAYRGLSSVRATLLRWLERRAAQLPATP